MTSQQVWRSTRSLYRRYARIALGRDETALIARHMAGHYGRKLEWLVETRHCSDGFWRAASFAS